MSETSALIKQFLASGGSIRKCPAGRAYSVKAQTDEERAIIKTRKLLAAYQVRFDALQEAIPVKRSVEEWASYNIKACDPHREIAEVAAMLVICRDEGAESAALFEKELTLTAN